MGRRSTSGSRTAAPYVISGRSEAAGTRIPARTRICAPDPTPLWNILDLTPGGRGTDWYPKLDYNGKNV